MGVGVDLVGRRNAGVGVVIVKIAVGVVVVVAAGMVAIGAVLNILRGKLLVAAMGAAGWILSIDVHLQQDGKIEADLQRATNPELRRCIP